MTRWKPQQRACAAAAAAFALLGTAACGDDDGGSDGGPYGTDPTSESASESPSETPAADTAALATATDDDHGEFLVDNDGFTLYLFTPDTEGESTCYDACATAWPPLLTDSADVGSAGAVDASLIGTVERTDGTTQVTYNGWPLYYYADDDSPGETDGQGLQSVWYLVAPGGDANKQDG